MFLLLVMTASLFTAHADEYAYLTFETTDGAKVSVPASSLSISLAGSTLTAGDHSFTLANLTKMYFSVSDQTTGIRSISAAEIDDTSEIYDLNGRKVNKSQMKKGVYVVKNKSGNYKIVVR